MVVVQSEVPSLVKSMMLQRFWRGTRTRVCCATARASSPPGLASPRRPPWIGRACLPADSPPSPLPPTHPPSSPKPTLAASASASVPYTRLPTAPYRHTSRIICCTATPHITQRPSVLRTKHARPGLREGTTICTLSVPFHFTARADIHSSGSCPRRRQQQRQHLPRHAATVAARLATPVVPVPRLLANPNRHSTTTTRRRR